MVMKTLLSVRQGTRTDTVRDTPRAFEPGILGSPTQLALNSFEELDAGAASPQAFCFL